MSALSIFYRQKRHRSTVVSKKLEMNLSSNFTPSNQLEGTDQSKNYMVCPFSPMDTDHQDHQGQQESDVLTPIRRLSLNMDESSQSPMPLDYDTGDADGGYGESIGSCVSMGSSDGLLLESNSRSPLVELNLNTPPSGIVHKRRTLQAKRLKSRPTSLIMERSPLSDNVMHSAPLMPTASMLPSLSVHTTHLPPSLSQPEISENLPMRSFQGSSLIRHISSPLEKMTLASPTGQTAFTFTFDSQSSTNSTNSYRMRSLTSTTESDGYFSEIEVFENDEQADSTSDTIKTLLNAPLSQDAPITFSASKEKKDLPCLTPIRPPQRSNSICQFNPTAIGPFGAQRCSLKRAGPYSELSQFHLPKRPPLPFLHCSNSQDSPIASAAETSPLSTNQLKGRSLLRSQSYCSPPLTGDGLTAPLSPGELIGDESIPYALPLVKGNAFELKCISAETLSKLIAGEFKDVVNTYSIIDCRYPYEFEGGHIRGAVNIWEKNDLLEKFFTTVEHPKCGQRTIYIFHCEFSSKRGPAMCRFLRENDRTKNGLDFPKLYYPELYLLDGGYKAFYQTFSDFCEPKNYRLMLDEKHTEDLRHCKQRAKSWAGDSVLQSRRQVPNRCRRRAPGSRPKSNSIDSTCSPSSSGTLTDK